MSNEVQILVNLSPKSKFENEYPFEFKDIIQSSSKYLQNDDVDDVADKIMLRVRETYSLSKDKIKLQSNQSTRALQSQVSTSRILKDSPSMTNEKIFSPQKSKQSLQSMSKQISVPDLFISKPLQQNSSTPLKIKKPIPTIQSASKPMTQKQKFSFNNKDQKLIPAKIQSPISNNESIIKASQLKPKQIKNNQKLQVFEENKQTIKDELKCSISLSEKSQDGQGLQLLDSLNGYLRKFSQVENNQINQKMKQGQKIVKIQKTNKIQKVESPLKIKNPSKEQNKIKVKQPDILEKQICSQQFAKALLDQLRSVKLIKDQYYKQIAD